MAGRTLAAIALLAAAAAQADPPHNLILFVADGLRASIVARDTAPNLQALREQGVDFVNSHALFPTLTTANASALATGHGLGDTGDFSNTLYVGFPVEALGGSRTPFLENDAVLAEIDRNARYGGNFLGEISILSAAAAPEHHYSTAALGKLGPVAIQDLRALEERGTLLIDDSSVAGTPLALPPALADAVRKAKFPVDAPGRAGNGDPGSAERPGTWVPNLAQQQYFLDLLTRFVLPQFKAAGQPFAIVYWSRDPDGTQHYQGDSPDSTRIGINGPTSLSAVRTADAALGTMRQALRGLGLEPSTNVIAVADHGFSTISKASRTSTSTKPTQAYPDVVKGEIPPGFLAIDILEGLLSEEKSLLLFDPDARDERVDWREGHHPRLGNGLIGHDAANPEVIVAANGGSDLIYLPTERAVGLARRIVDLLLRQDYTSGLFVDDALGSIPGTLPTSAIGLKGVSPVGAAKTPPPSIVVNFRSFAPGHCRRPITCVVEVADTTLEQGQGMHGSFSRADTWNFMAAAGPDFRQRYRDSLPASNADIGMTIAYLLRLESEQAGAFAGRILTESLRGEPRARVARVSRSRRVSPAGVSGLRTVLDVQTVDDKTYFDAGGFPGRTFGLTTLDAGR